MKTSCQLSAVSGQLGKTANGMKNQNIKPITKARKLESTKKGLCFYVTPSSFVSSPFRLPRGMQLFSIFHRGVFVIGS